MGDMWQAPLGLSSDQWGRTRDFEGGRSLVLIAIPALVDELKAIAIEIGNICCVVTRGAVDVFGGSNLVAAPGLHSRFVAHINSFSTVTANAEVTSLLTGIPFR